LLATQMRSSTRMVACQSEPIHDRLIAVLPGNACLQSHDEGGAFPMKKSKQPKTHFVPRVVFEAAFAGVVPICVAPTAGGCTSPLTVADIAFDAGDGDAASPAPDASDASAARDAPNRDAPIFSVAFIGFDGGVADIGFDGGVADNAFRVPDASDAGDAHDSDATFAVADAGFRPPDGSAG
jgi:hypothetical protein